MASYIWLVIVLPLAGFIINGLGRNVLPKNLAAIIGCGTVLTSFILVLTMFIQLLNGAQPVVVSCFDWITVGNFSIPAAFQVDQLSVLMMLIITGVGFLIHLYSVGYMHHDEGFNRFFAYLNLFIFFMLLLVTGANYLMLFVGWEGVGLCSYLLIGFWNKNNDYNKAANKAFIMNRVGDLGFLLGMLLIYITFGSLSYSDVFPKAAQMSMGDPTLLAITLLLFIGATGKSAQIPLYTWLPDAMAGPTPVSALIHAATMVTAGIYLIVRSNILFALSPVTLSIISVVGVVTALFAATIGLFQNDIKKVLAYSTVSQLGYLFLAVGVGAYTSAMFHLTTHAFFKALLFLGAGSVIHAMGGIQDIRKMGGLKKAIPVTFITFLLGTIAISGIPPFSGFFSKDEILAKVFEQNPLLWGLAVLGSLLTAFYMFRLLYLTFWGEFRGTEHEKHHLHESPKTMTIPLIVLAVLSVVGGVIGLPAILSHSHALDNYLSPIYQYTSALPAAEHAHALSHATEWALIGFMVALLAVIIFMAHRTYNIKKVRPVADGAPMSSVQKLIYNKYYIDELYDATIVRLVELKSNVLAWIDNNIIGNISTLVGQTFLTAGRGLRLLQTGSVAFYLLLMILGVIVILLTRYLL